MTLSQCVCSASLSPSLSPESASRRRTRSSAAVGWAWTLCFLLGPQQNRRLEGDRMQASLASCHVILPRGCHVGREAQLSTWSELHGTGGVGTGVLSAGPARCHCVRSTGTRLERKFCSRCAPLSPWARAKSNAEATFRLADARWGGNSACAGLTRTGSSEGCPLR